MKGALAGLLLLFTPFAAAASEPPPSELRGVWEGVLDAGEGPLPVVLKVGDTITGDSPSQGVTDLPATLSRSGERWRLEFTTIGATLEGAVGPDGKFAGSYSQNGLVVPLVLEKKTATD